MKSSHPPQGNRAFAKLLISLSVLCLSSAAFAGLPEEVVGQWKLVSHTSTFQGQEFDSPAALLQQRPCAADIVCESTRTNRSG